ncbi:MAG: efflux RND transporter periplasmic adaptor subunit [Candidatus Rokubacteria bacterium]|nr:efflux RND transporter periplasmic adaptor subunit [Candidatus Rokubacteria bacterium]
MSGRAPGWRIRPVSSLPALVAVALAIAGCWGDPSGAQTTKDKAPSVRILVVAVAPVEARAVERTVDATGSLLPWQEVILNTNASGTVARLLVDLGDRVGEDQVVAELDPRELALAVEQADAGARAARDSLARARAQVEVAQAQLRQVRQSRRSLEAALNRTRAALEETKVNLARMQSLVERALVAQRDVDVARTQYEAALAQHETAQVELSQFPDRVRVAEAQLESDRSAVRVGEADLRRREAELALARKRLGDLTLRAPIAGAIARRHLNPGQYVSENTPVFTIVRSDLLKFTGTVAEHAALHVRPGQPVRVRVEPVPNRQFAGRVTRVSPAVDVTSRTVQVEAEVPNPEGLLKPGLFARAALVLREDRDVAFVPESAISYFAGITRVFVVADGTARERTVSLGARQDGLVEVVKGVEPGEQVATSGLAQLQDGAAVKAAPADGRGAQPAPRTRRASRAGGRPAGAA